MRDETAGKRVKKYREAQKRDRGIVRVDVQVPEGLARETVKAIASRLRGASKSAGTPNPALDLVLGTINAPRPTPIDGPTLVQCLLSPAPIPRWKPHIETLFDEVSIEAVHHVVLSGVVDFEDLYRAARTWRIIGGRSVDWVREMADYSLGHVLE